MQLGCNNPPYSDSMNLGPFYGYLLIQQYMAPVEGLNSSIGNMLENVDMHFDGPWCDIYSLGVLILHASINKCMIAKIISVSHYSNGKLIKIICNDNYQGFPKMPMVTFTKFISSLKYVFFSDILFFLSFFFFFFFFLFFNSGE